MHLIQSKIERPKPAPHLVRDRLVTTIESSVNTGLATFIVGRAGTGKTIAASDAATVVNGRVAWYAVDESDTELEHFANYLSETLGFPGGAPNNALLADRVADHFIGAFFERSDVPALLVVENLHFVYDTPWFGPFITRLLPLLPLNVHILFTTRALPTVPLWRLRSKQTLTVVDEAALAFTEDEAIQLFARHGLSPTGACAGARLTHGRADRLDALARCLSRDLGPASGISPFESRICRTG